MRRRAVLLTVVALGVGYAVWHLPVTRRFTATVREAAARREADLREAVEVAVDRDAQTRAPRHAARGDLTTPTSPLGAGNPGRSLSAEEAHALLLDPTGERAP